MLDVEPFWGTIIVYENFDEISHSGTENCFADTYNQAITLWPTSLTPHATITFPMFGTQSQCFPGRVVAPKEVAMDRHQLNLISRFRSLIGQFVSARIAYLFGD